MLASDADFKFDARYIFIDLLLMRKVVRVLTEQVAAHVDQIRGAIVGQVHDINVTLQAELPATR